MIEYGIAKNTNNLANPQGIICSGLSKEEAENWIDDHLASRGSPTEFCIVSRQVSEWDLAEDAYLL